MQQNYFKIQFIIHICTSIKYFHICNRVFLSINADKTCENSMENKSKFAFPTYSAFYSFYFSPHSLPVAVLGTAGPGAEIICGALV